jgi:hypothetical protein
MIHIPEYIAIPMYSFCFQVLLVLNAQTWGYISSAVMHSLVFWFPFPESSRTQVQEQFDALLRNTLVGAIKLYLALANIFSMLQTTILFLHYLKYFFKCRNNHIFTAFNLPV